jgi:aminopeptidase N
MIRQHTRRFFLLFVLTILRIGIPTDSALPQEKTGDLIDVVHYKIDGEINPEQYTLNAKTTVTLKVLTQTRSVTLEMNGSLVVSKVIGANNKPLEFLQDRLDRLDVRVDLGEVVEAEKEIVLTFEYAGALRTPDGGPVADKRLAYVGPEGAYLFYAARWFPFHKYAADLAACEINLTTPAGWAIAGYSQSPITNKTIKNKVTFMLAGSEPTLPGSLAVANYMTKEMTTAVGLKLEFFVKPGDERFIAQFSEPIGKMVEVYSARFGPFAFGDRLRVAEIDSESLDYYSGPGTLFLSPRILTGEIPFDPDRLAREVAYQWWGLAVPLKSFDHAWVSQGLAQYSALLFRQETGSNPEYEQAVQEAMERALTFESAASIARAPGELYDLSPSYISIIYYKGAFVYHMLRTLLGDDKFFKLLATYYQTFKGKNAGLGDFESLTTQIAGRNMRSFFGQWVDSTGVPEFRVEYLIIRTKEGKFKVRGTVKQNFEIFDMPVELRLRAEGGNDLLTIQMKGTDATFEIPSETLPLEVVVDPSNKILHISPSIRINVIVRRGIEHLKGREYPEAEQEFRAAIEQDPQSSWAHYNLGLLYFEQRNYQRALDTFNEALNSDRRPSWTAVWSYIYRGNCWDALAQRERAVAEYQKAVETNDNYNNAQQTAQQYLAKPFEHQR